MSADSIIIANINHAIGKNFHFISAKFSFHFRNHHRSNSRLVGDLAKNISSVPSDKTRQEKTLARAIGGSGTKDQKRKVSGSIKGETEKALLIRFLFLGGKEMWVPKSTVDLGYNRLLKDVKCSQIPIDKKLVWNKFCKAMNVIHIGATLVSFEKLMELNNLTDSEIKNSIQEIIGGLILEKYETR